MAVDKLARILDANFNRAKEGLRVCEDICRYGWDKKILTSDFKNIRHDLTVVMDQLNIRKALRSRDIGADVGKKTTHSESQRKDLSAVFGANIQRVKESLRVLEEVAKITDAASADRLKKLRYKVYALEQKSFV